MRTVKGMVFIPKLCTVESHREYKTRLPLAASNGEVALDKKNHFPGEEEGERERGRGRSGQAGRGEWGNQATNRREGEISGEEHPNVKRVNCAAWAVLGGFLEAFGYVFDKEISRISKVSSLKLCTVCTKNASK